MENGGPGSRGAGSRRTGSWDGEKRALVENAGSGGKRGVRWKTRGLVENAGSNLENTGYLTKMTGQNIVS